MECAPTISSASRLLLQLGRQRSTSPRRSRSDRFFTVASQDSKQQQQLNLSVLRFTFGIPGLDESYLPRWIGVACGSVILLNHFISSSPTPAQLRSEALGLCLAAFSTALPYLGKFLKGVDPVDRSSIPEGNKQIFIMSENISVTQKEDFAWGSYALLRNTNTMSVLIAVQDALCARGYWNMPEDFSKAQILEWFKIQIKQVGFLELKDDLYFPQSIDSQLREMLPKGVLSLLVQPIYGASDPTTTVNAKAEGFVLLASTANYAYSERDRAWIRAIAHKFQGLLLPAFAASDGSHGEFRAKESPKDILNVKGFVDKKAWRFVQNDLCLKASYLLYDLNTIIAAKPKEAKKPLKELTGTLFATIDELDHAAKIKSSTEEEKSYAATKSVIGDVIAMLD